MGGLCAEDRWIFLWLDPTTPRGSWLVRAKFMDSNETNVPCTGEQQKHRPPSWTAVHFLRIQGRKKNVRKEKLILLYIYIISKRPSLSPGFSKMACQRKRHTQMNASLLRGISEEVIHFVIFRKLGTNCPKKKFRHMHKVSFFFQLNWVFGLKCCLKLSQLGIKVTQEFLSCNC